MDLAKYQELTGITVKSSQTNLVEAQIRRTQRVLETLLGFTLDPDKAGENLYNEQGKAPTECACSNVDAESLQDPDPLQGAYRMYSYDSKDRYFHVDPFCTVYSVKLVVDGVTIKTFEPDEYRVHYGRDGMAKYIENCQYKLCACTCADCVQLAVEANWLWQDAGDLPEDLLDVWSDMITYNVDCKKNIRSETIGPHTYTKFDKEDPVTFKANLAVLKRYAGPYGAVTKVLV